MVYDPLLSRVMSFGIVLLPPLFSNNNVRFFHNPFTDKLVSSTLAEETKLHVSTSVPVPIALQTAL